MHVHIMTKGIRVCGYARVRVYWYAFVFRLAMRAKGTIYVYSRLKGVLMC